MNIPKLFMPKKNMEKKIKQLLKEKTEKKETGFIIDKEAEHSFPNFINYLKEEYNPLIIQKTRTGITLIWTVSNYDKKDKFANLGSIKTYVTNKDLTSEYGYEIEIYTKGKFRKLVYREGYHCYDSIKKSVVSSKHPLRCDKESIPFP